MLNYLNFFVIYFLLKCVSRVDMDCYISILILKGFYNLSINKKKIKEIEGWIKYKVKC